MITSHRRTRDEITWIMSRLSLAPERPVERIVTNARLYGANPANLENLETSRTYFPSSL
jgi:hypothetical protein